MRYKNDKISESLFEENGLNLYLFIKEIKL